MQPKIRVMKYTIVIADSETEESLDRGLPYEKFLLGDRNASAPLELRSLGHVFTDSSCIARIEPVHIHAARDHLVLTNTSILDITQDESDALFDSVKDIFAEMASITHRPYPGRWFIETSAMNTLSTVSTQQAEGRNIDHWMPCDTTTPGVARQWRKWQNEIQMIWFNHPINEARQDRDMLPVNSVWISGIGSISDIEIHDAFHQCHRVHSPDHCLSLMAKHLNKEHIENIESSQLAQTLSLLSAKDKVTLQTWEMACQALIGKEIEAIQIIDFPDSQERNRIIRLEDLPRKGFGFWKKPMTPKLQDMLSV